MKKNSFIRMKMIFIIMLTASVTIGHAQVDGSSISQEKKIKTSISYCNLEIPKDLKSANIAFSIFYMFKVDGNGKVIDIEKKRDEYVGEQIAKSCIADWEVTGVPDNSWFGVSFFWTRNKGWFRQTVQSYKLAFSQTMEMEGVGIVKLTNPKKVEKP